MPKCVLYSYERFLIHWRNFVQLKSSNNSHGKNTIGGDTHTFLGRPMAWNTEFDNTYDVVGDLLFHHTHPTCDKQVIPGIISMLGGNKQHKLKFFKYHMWMYPRVSTTWASIFIYTSASWMIIESMYHNTLREHYCLQMIRISSVWLKKIFKKVEICR